MRRRKRSTAYNYFRLSRLYTLRPRRLNANSREPASARKGEERRGRIVNFGKTLRSRSKQANPFVCSFVRRESEGHESADSSPPPLPAHRRPTNFASGYAEKKQEAREVAELAIRGRQGKNPFLKPRFPPHPCIHTARRP